MSGVFRFDFYGKDWIVDTRELSPEARGIYIDTLSAIYLNGGPIPFDMEYLRSLYALKSIRTVKRILAELVEKKKLHIVENMIVNYRSEEVLADISLRIERGKRGGKACGQNLGDKSLGKVSPKFPQNFPETSSKLGGKNEQNQGPNVNIFNSHHSPSININSYNDDGSLFEGGSVSDPKSPIKIEELDHIKDMFQGHDIEYLENIWLEWNENKGINVMEMRNPAGALIGFCKKHIEANR